MTKLKIAVVGSGFAGLASAYHLAKQGAQVTIYSEGFPSGASSIAAGLLHKYVGKKGLKNWRADEGFIASKELIEVSESALGRSVATKNGILRVPISDEQEETLLSYPDNEKVKGGILMHEGLGVHCTSYLQGLKIACESLGVTFKGSEAPIDGLRVLCKGAQTTESKVNLIKGQLLKLKLPKGFNPLLRPLISSKYFVMDPNPEYLWVGSTYERNFESADPDVEIAKSLILPKAIECFPALQEAEIIECVAALRAFTPDRKPTLKQLNDTTWAVFGLGSKGLLYHALLAQELSNRFFG